MKENNIENEIGEEKQNDLEENTNTSLNNEESEEISENKNQELSMLSSQLGENSEPKMEVLDDIIQNDSANLSSISYQILDTNNIILSKNLYISKDFIFILILLLSSGLNFSYLYLPFFILVVSSYFLLYKSSKKEKRCKTIIEILSLIYAICLLIFKIYFIVSIKQGKNFMNINQLLLDLGILNLLEQNSYYFLLASFLGEIFVIIISIYALIISYISKDTDVSEYIKPEHKLTFDEFYTLMSHCMFLFYFAVVGWSIFNRSLLTLFYLMPMNLLIYILAMNFIKFRKGLFFIFKIFSVFLFFVIFIHLISINVFNVDSIRDYFLKDAHEVRENYPRVVNIFTKIGINQAFHKDMKGKKLAEEYFGYFFGCLALLVLMYISKKLTLSKFRKSLRNKDKGKSIFDLDNEENTDDENSISFFKKFMMKLKQIIYNPSFSLHICRISAILWLVFYQNFYSIGVIIWLFFSFIFLKVTSNKYVTVIFLAPMVFVCLFCYHLANIDGIIQNKDNEKIYTNFALGKFKHKNVEYILCNIFYFLITIFIYRIFRIKKEKDEEKKIAEINNDIILDKKEKLKQNLIKKEEEGDYNINILPEEEEKEDDEFNAISKEVNELIEDDKKESKEKSIKELYDNLTLINILIQVILDNLDKITLVILYILSVYSINIVHFILVIIFMLQLIFPQFVKKYSLIFIILSQIFFLIEYCIDLLKHSDYSENTINLIKLFIPFDIKEITIDFLLYIMTYCYYFQYFQYHSRNYQLHEDISLEIYIKVVFHNYQIIQKILFGFGKIIKEIYIWTLIAIFIIFNGLFEISIFFAVSLLIFLIIIFKFLRKVEDQKKGEINNISCYFLIAFCVINTICVYVFQILCLDLFDFNDTIEKTDNFFIKNLPALGLYRYFNEKLLLKFLPHFIGNIISKLLLNEMENISLNEKMEKISDKNFIKNNCEKLIEYKQLLEREKKLEEENKKKMKELESNLEPMPSPSSSISFAKQKNSNEISNKKSSSDISFKSIESEDIAETEKNILLDEYTENKNKMSMLDIKYLYYNIMLVITKFYWIFLFLFVCIISTTYDLSLLLLIYIMIFGIIFMRMFYFIISRLSLYTEKCNKEGQYSFFISKLIRYNLIEKSRHINDNKKFRSLGFKCLIVFNFLSYFLFYLDAIFNIFQNGCKNKIYENCDTNHIKIVDKGGLFENVSENLIISISYIIGFNANLSNGTVLFHAWFHIFFGALLCFDAYVQIIEDHFNEKCKLNRREYRHLANENILLKPKIYEQQNALKNIQAKLISIQENEEYNQIEEEEIKTKEIAKPILVHKETIQFDINAQEQKQAGEDLINKFKQIFKDAAKEIDKKKVQLSSSNNKLKIIITIKNIFEEIIIFFLICTAVAKLNIWSLVYIIYSIYLILTQKTIKKYYILYCFIISSIMIQFSLFVSNLQKSTDPNPDDDYIDIMEKTFHLPWYKLCGMSDEHAFFFGLGVCHSQINLIWMDFIQVVVIYIYLDFFSYSIYQEGKTIGKSQSSISYYNLHLNEDIKKATKKLTEKEYNGQFDCMKYNFGIEIEDKVNSLEKFKYYIEHGCEMGNKKNDNEEDGKILEEKNDEEKNIELSPIMKRLLEVKKAKEKEDKNKEASSNLKNKEMSENKCMNIVRNFFYLSFHNLILILIITISMMISGFISVIYIIISLYFLLTSTKLYLGEKYSYPRLIKKFLRIMILVDILLQIIYQNPYIDMKTQSDEESTFYTVLGYIGLNKIIVFGIDEEKNFSVDIGWAEMFLVLTKVLLYFLISLQILIYSSQSFLEFYFGFIITKNSYFRRVKFMNVFKFNNKRIEVMDRTIKLRQDMSKKMKNLGITLQKWNENIMKKKKELETGQEIKEEEENNIINTNLPIEDEIEEIEEIELKEKEQEKEDELPQLKINAEKTKSEETKKIKNEDKTLFVGKISESEHVIPNKREINVERYLSSEEVISQVKSWIINGFLIKMQISLHKLVANYNNISDQEKYIYERYMIQGKSKVNTLLEDEIESELNAIDIEHFTESDMKELKQYFDGTRKKKLEKLKNKKKKLQKMKKMGEKIIALNKITKKEKTAEEKKELNIIKEKILKERKELREEREKEYINKRKINIREPKYKNFIKISQNNIFDKYLSKSYIIQTMLKDILSFFSNNFHWLCYFVMILNHIMSYSIISLIYPLSIFCYAIMEYPRPKKSYWKFCFIYTIFFLLIKFIIQLAIWKRINDYEKIIKILENYRLGLTLYESTFSKDFFIYILFDSLVLVFLLINNYLLVFAGLYNKREQEIETIYQANERIAKTKDLKFNNIEDIKKFNEDYITELEKKLETKESEELTEEENDILDAFDDLEESKIGRAKNLKEVETLKETGYFKRLNQEKNKKLQEQKKFKENQKKLQDESNRSYYEALFPKVRNEKPGNEFYVYYTLAITLIIIYIFFLYTIMIKDKTFGSVSLQTKQFSGEMVCFLLLHIAILLLDRVIYIRQNRNHLKYEYILYDKKNKKIIDNINDFDDIENFQKFKKNDTVIPTKYEDDLKDYNIIYIQRETFNAPLLEKYILQIFIVIFGHLFIFFFMPMYGNYKLNRTVYCKENDKECNDFLKNVSLPIFYIFYLFYFIPSGLQIKYGFYDMKKKSVLKAKNNTLYGGIYAGYKNIPFLYEIKLGIDWTFTATGLDLFQWNKFESLYDVIFTTNCSMNSINNKKVGKIVTKKYKFGLGGVLSFVLIFVLVGPLLLFSSLNPTNELNNPTNSDLTVELSFLFKNKLMKNYTLYQNLKPQSIEPISNDDLINFNYTISPETKNFPIEQIQTIIFFEENDRNWDLSLPHIKNLIELIQSRNKNISSDDTNYVERIDLVMDYTFYRRLPPEAQVAKKRYNSTIFTRGENNTEQDDNLSMLGNALENCSNANITFKNKFYPPIRLRAKSHPKSMKSKEYFHNLDVQLGFRGCKKNYNESGALTPSYLESYFTFALFEPKNKSIAGIKFHVFSDKVSTTTFSYSALGFYFAFVLVVGNYVRNFFSGQAEKIILTEMPHNEELMDLCEGIKIARYSYDFEEEEKLYYILIEIMRSPDYLRLLTSSSVDQFNDRLKMTKLEEEINEENKKEKKDKNEKNKKV